MVTDLTYIDSVLNLEVQRRATEPTLNEAQRSVAAEKSRKVIAGFSIHDEEAERAYLDGLISKRKQIIEKFRQDRTAVRGKLAALGVTPLAVCPLAAWQRICRDSGLYVLCPDRNGQVGIARHAFDGLTDAQIDGVAPTEVESSSWTGMFSLPTPRYHTYLTPDALLRRYFPDGVSVDDSYVKATVILPTPPQDVAEILCKVQALPLKVAAVAEAISFAETPRQLKDREAVLRRAGRPHWERAGYSSYQEWLEKCPIVFTEHGDAAAIVAQFGTFPIEKQVVDTVVASDGLIAERPQVFEDISSPGSVVASTVHPGVFHFRDDWAEMYERSRRFYQASNN